MTTFTTSLISRSALLLILLLPGVSGSSHAQQLVPPCDRNAPETCLYTSDLHYDVGVIDGLELVDPSRNNYRVPLLIHYPIGVAGPRPVVIWNQRWQSLSKRQDTK